MATAPLDFAHPHVLRNKREFGAAVTEVNDLLDRDPEKGTAAYDRLVFLSVLIEAYETERDVYPAVGTPQEVVDFMLGQRGMTRHDLNAIMGGKSRVSEFFNGVRALSIAQIRALRDMLGIPADLLLA